MRNIFSDTISRPLDAHLWTQFEKSPLETWHPELKQLDMAIERNHRIITFEDLETIFLLMQVKQSKLHLDLNYGLLLIVTTLDSPFPTGGEESHQI